MIKLAGYLDIRLSSLQISIWEICFFKLDCNSQATLLADMYCMSSQVKERDILLNYYQNNIDKQKFLKLESKYLAAGTVMIMLACTIKIVSMIEKFSDDFSCIVHLHNNYR